MIPVPHNHCRYVSGKHRFGKLKKGRGPWHGWGVWKMRPWLEVNDTPELVAIFNGLRAKQYAQAHAEALNI